MGAHAFVFGIEINMDVSRRGSNNSNHILNMQYFQAESLIDLRQLIILSIFVTTCHVIIVSAVYISI